MEHNPVPSIPEIIDMYNTLKKGIYGIQMSEETAVGKYPKKCLEIIEGIIDEIDNEKNDGLNIRLKKRSTLRLKNA